MPKKKTAYTVSWRKFGSKLNARCGTMASAEELANTIKKNRHVTNVKIYKVKVKY